MVKTCKVQPLVVFARYLGCITCFFTQPYMQRFVAFLRKYYNVYMMIFTYTAPIFKGVYRSSTISTQFPSRSFQNLGLRNLGCELRIILPYTCLWSVVTPL